MAEGKQDHIGTKLAVGKPSPPQAGPQPQPPVVSAAKRRRRRRAAKIWLDRLVLGAMGLLMLTAVVWSFWVYSQIEWYAQQDQAVPADAIVVFGAAEYDGHPSPVLRARLDHALLLYRRGIAPLIVTLGGVGEQEQRSGSEPHSEGGVGKQYLMANGVPEEAIIAETESRSTEESARRVAVIARANGLKRIVIVSDDTHVFRIHEICAADGLNVFTSPRPQLRVVGSAGEFQQVMHEILSYTAWRLRLH